MVSVYIRLATAEKVQFDMELTATIKQFKDAIGTNQNVEPERITLVFKGKVLKDESTLEGSGIIDGSIVHMVVMKKKEQPAAPKVEPVKPAPVSTPTPATTPSFTSPSTRSPFNRTQANNTMSQYASMMQDPQMAAANTSMMESFKQNPEMFLNLIKMDPGMRNVIEKNPQMEAMLNDPATLDYLMDMMSSPEKMQDAMKQADAAMNNISDIPGGEAMLERVMNQYYEPLDKAQDRKGFSKPTEGDAAAARQTTVPNLWGAPSPNRPSTQPAPQMNSFMSGPMGGSMGGPMEEETDKIMSQIATQHPEILVQMLKASPEYQQMVQQNPMMASMMENPEVLKQVMSPENLQMARNMMHNGGMGGMGGMGFQPPERLTTEQLRQRYAIQIQQIEGMGFHVDDQVLQVLHRFGGNVERTIDFLLQ